MQHQARALQMLEKADAETGTFGGALDQAGDVDHHERTAGAGGDHARLRMEGRERVVGDLRACGRHRGKQRSEEHTSELQSLMRISYAVFCLKKKNVKAATRR